MRIKNLLIILAVVAAIILVIQYIRQVRSLKRGDHYVSGGRVFLNWLMALILVGSLVGIGVQSFASQREASSKPAKVSEPVKKSNKTTEDVEVTVNFKKKVHLDENGTAKVKFLISPKTKVVIKGHRSGEVFETFKASSGNAVVTKQMTFDTPGTYDIIATRGKKKVIKHLKVEEYTESSSSESSSSSSSSQSSSNSSHSTSSSSSHSSSSSNAGSSNGGNDTANSNTGGSANMSAGNSYQGSTGGGSSSYRQSNYGGGNGGGSRSNAIPSQPGYSGSAISDQPE